MDAYAEVHLTRGDTSQNSLAGGPTVDHQHEPKTALNEASVLDNFSLSPSNAHSSLVTDGGAIETHKGQSPIHPFESDQDSSDIQTGDRVDHERSCTHLQGNSDQVILPATFERVGPSLMRARISSAAACAERDANSVDRSIGIRMLYTEQDDTRSDSLASLAGEENTREDFDYPCGNLPSSLPPSSSPPQLFSSSPFASSPQSSADDVRPSKIVLAVEVEDCKSSQYYPDADSVISLAQGESCLEPKNLHSREIIDIAASPETDKNFLQINPTICNEGGPGPSRKRIGYQNDPGELPGPQPTKRPKLASDLYLPPTPKRPTLASQHRQFKKLAAPFRPPSKLPAVIDELTQTMNKRKLESTVSATPETSHDRIDIKGSTVHIFPSQHKASNTSRSVTQFKSPLVNRDLAADSRTIRLTPAVQALERKLQLLKRAVKVKEEKEEETLAKLAGKWIEAGREVAYGVWDAVKGAGTFEGKATFVRGSYGWGSADNGNTPWGWDTKPGDACEESCDRDPPLAPCGAERLVPEEGDDVSCNTLGTMLRQLGIAPGIFGWDDDKEAFSD